ncbi:hypothetical protein EVAR_27382_1 [Eumeta japonica]|uniref:Uncharacterized protein n=1 Tax=Eumeta variegata TaxID=151549 RepID=A0A4C1X2Z2_EUMVA|nr:hypothetical protein EVAR_27382_1 [Eumeta japonica]
MHASSCRRSARVNIPTPGHLPELVSRSFASTSSEHQTIATGLGTALRSEYRRRCTKVDDLENEIRALAGGPE